MELDRISGLPNDVTEKILSRLPLREAVRTSVLSRKWRYKSSMLQDLMFDDLCVSTQSHPTYSFENIVDHVLLLHTGPIHKFQLSRNGELLPKHMDRWIFHLSRNPVLKELTLEIWEGDPYSIPSCLFSCQDIVDLVLSRCLLNPPTPPSTFKGFRNLKTLTFWSVNLAQDVLENLIAGSPLLEMLELEHCDGFTNLKIDAPNLRFMHIRGVLEDVNLENASNLAVVALHLKVNVDQRRGLGNSGNLLKFFYRKRYIQRLTIDRNFLKYLSIGTSPKKLIPTPCQYLSFISVDLCFDVLDEILTVLCLLTSSPALQELKILVEPKKDHAALGEVKYSLYDFNCAYTQLRLVKITNISGRKAELDFIEFLLLSSPVLQRLTVKPASFKGFSKLVKELLMFKRGSKQAEIMLLDP